VRKGKAAARMITIMMIKKELMPHGCIPNLGCFADE